MDRSIALALTDWLLMTQRCFSSLLLSLFALTFLPPTLLAADKPKTDPTRKEAAVVSPALPADWVKALNWRCIGPANMGGRIVALSVCETDPSTYWVATASGGLLKTTNNGITFEHQFDREATVSIGDVCVAPSNRDIVWVGTGENNPRNSVSYGDGVYKSTDGGKTWKNMGLKKSFQIGRLAIHPKNPDIVYVGALGRLYGPSEERGLYKTTDGGKTWQKLLFINDKTGVIDIAMNPQDPDTLLVATWEVQRDGYDSWPGEVRRPEALDGYDPIVRWGTGAGLYRTTDGGKTFTKLTKGLPTGKLGRIGLDIYRKDPRIVYAIIDSENIGKGPAPLTAYLGAVAQDDGKQTRLSQVWPGSPAEKAGLKVGDVVEEVGGQRVTSFDAMLDQLRKRKPGEEIAFKVIRGEEARTVQVKLTTRPGAGTTGRAVPGATTRPAVSSAYMGIIGEDADEGALLTQVIADGPADKAGLKADDVIQSVDGKKVADYAGLLSLLRERKPQEKIKLTVQRGKETKEFEVTLGQRPTVGGGGTPALRNRPYLASLGGQNQNLQDQQGSKGFEYGGVYRSEDGGQSWVRVNSLNPRPMYFSQIRVDPSDASKVYVLGVSQYRSEDGGQSFAPTLSRGVHADGHALWINPRDGRHMLIGSDGGTYVSYDRGANWDHLNHVAIAQFYHVAVSPRRPYYVYGGLQDNGSWGGPASRSGGIVNEDWLSINGGDGFVCRVDPSDPDLIYTTSQGGAMRRRNLRTGETAAIRPNRVPGVTSFRFNWNTPFLLSNHNPRIFYAGSQFVHRSLDRGNDLRTISPELTKTKRGSCTALAESPRNPDVLWAGTDDGALWVTRDGGKTWSDVTSNVGLPGLRWVATIEASRFAEGRAYVAFDGHRSDDDRPYAYVTEDFGKSWKSITPGLPEFGSTRTLREDLYNANLLYCGTEFALFASIDRGATWTRINNNLPTVAVHEVALHPTAGELVAATHGRSLWVLDVSALRQITPTQVRGDKAVLYAPLDAERRVPEPARGRTNRRFVGENPPPGASLWYALPKKADKLTLKILDIDGNTIRELRAPTEAGLHRVSWDLTQSPLRRAGTTPAPGAATGRTGRQTPAGAAGAGVPLGRPVAPGTYRVVLEVDGQTTSRPIRVLGDAPSPTPRPEGEDD